MTGRTATGRSASVPGRARIVIIGGGVGGASVAYHLAEAGETDVVLVERAELTSGSTFHSAGLVGQLRADPTLTRMNMYSVELYRRLQQTPNPPGWVESGGIKLASTHGRLEEIRRQVGWARGYGLPLHEISVAEAHRLFPLMEPAGVVGAAYLESDGHVDPSQLCHALTAVARANGVTICHHTRVLGIDTAGGAVTGVRTDRGDLECEVVVDCGGMFAAEIARMVGVRVPVVPVSHQYVVTEPFLTSTGFVDDRPLPTLRDPDLLVYWRQEVDGLVMGGYERNPEPWSASATSYDQVPPDFNGHVLPAAWERFEELASNATVRVPAMERVGLRTMINGPEAFTPDNEFCLGETAVAGFFVAAGFCAHGIAGAGGVGKVMAEWVLDGEPEYDLWHMDISRFGSAYESPGYTMARTLETYRTYYDIGYPHRERTSGRPLRTSPVYPWHRAHGAVFGEKAGWERVNYYTSNEPDGDETLRPRGWAGRDWSPATGVEHTATRTAAALFDETSFAKLDVSGPDAARFLDLVCDNAVARRVGDVTYTQALNGRGGIEADFTVVRLAVDRFRVVTGTAFGSHDLAWLRKQARQRDVEVSIDDVTGQLACFALWGPASRDILQPITPADLSDDAFGFMTARHIAVGNVPVHAVRVSFSGELGWELYASTEYGAGLWATLYTAGQPHGLRAAGYRAIESLRLERGFRVWGSDVTPETNPYEAGLGFCVKLDKPGGFVGAAALRAVRANGVARRLCCIVLDDPRAVVVGGEPVRVPDPVVIGGEPVRVPESVVIGGEPVRVPESAVGRVTSGGYGYTIGRSIAYCYLPIDATSPGQLVEVDLFGEWVPAKVAEKPLAGRT